ncbi:MAG: hypothetical protein NT075_30125 [Chloroflexi bacterium]|nr:hypothetical protein [Chloroflexota bacterium]
MQPDLRRRLGRNLRYKVEQEYCAPVIAQRWTALFDELLDGALPGGKSGRVGGSANRRWPAYSAVAQFAEGS